MSSPAALVSIALCTYNGARYLREQLDSLIAQDYPNLEIVIVDDCSSDETVSIIGEYLSPGSVIRFTRNETNIGFNQNFGKALSNCRGDYIAIADQDDIWLPGKISAMMRHIGTDLLLYHNSAYIDEKGTETGRSTLSHHRFVRGHCALNLLYFNCVSGHACLVSRELLGMLPPFPADFYYDWWMAYTAACQGRINYLTQTWVKHRKHSGSFTGNDRSRAASFRAAHFRLFMSHPGTPAKARDLLDALLTEYEALANKKFSVTLFLLLLRNAGRLFYVRRKSAAGLMKLILKECRGN